MALEIRYYNANSLKDDIQFVTVFWDTLYIFLGHPVHCHKSPKFDIVLLSAGNI